LQEPHGVTFQKTPFFIVTAVKTSNLKHEVAPIFLAFATLPLFARKFRHISCVEKFPFLRKHYFNCFARRLTEIVLKDHDTTYHLADGTLLIIQVLFNGIRNSLVHSTRNIPENSLDSILNPL
jgi:hypothetical protein